MSYYDFNIFNLAGESPTQVAAPAEEAAEGTAHTNDAESASAKGNGNGDDANPEESSVDAETFHGAVFLSPTRILKMPEDPSKKLVGDGHIVKGEIQVLAGPGGSGKSWATMLLALCGAKKETWFGLEIHRTFKTMILQSENGMPRLKSFFAEAGEAELLDEYVLVSKTPSWEVNPLGAAFLESLRKDIERFQPELLIIDPLNLFGVEHDMTTLKTALKALRGVMPKQNRPALLLVHHTKKNAKGNADDLSGSHHLKDVARCVWTIKPMGSEGEDGSGHRVEFRNVKLNNGPKSKPGQWVITGVDHRQVEISGSLEEEGKRGPKPKCTVDDLREILGACHDGLSKQELFEGLVKRTGLAEGTVRNKLRPQGELGCLLERNDGVYRLKAEEPNENGNS